MAHNSNLQMSEQDFNIYFNQLRSKLINNFGYSSDMVEQICKIKIHSSNSRNDSNKEFLKLKEEANNYFSQKKFTEAINKYSEALDLQSISDNEKAILYSNKGNSYYELYSTSKNEQFLSESLKNAKMAINLNPEYIKAYYRVAKIYELKEKYDKALLFYSKCLILNPESQDIKNLLASLKFKIREKKRNANLFSEAFPMSIEEVYDYHINKIVERTGKILDKSKFQNNLKSICDYVPGMEEVWKAHECYHGSDTNPQNFKQAIKMFEKAVEKDNAEAAYNLGLMYQLGQGVGQDFSKAIHYFEQASKCSQFFDFHGQKINNVGVAEAQYSLGILYMEGIYVKKDINLGKSYYEKALENGSNGAANNLGLEYYNGKNFTQDFYKAEKLFLLAHSQNNQQALTNLVDLYVAMGQFDKALEWHKKGVEKGCLFCISRDKHITNYLKDEINSFEELQIKEWEKEQNLQPENLNQMERIERFMEIKFGLPLHFLKANKKKERKFFLDPLRIQLLNAHRNHIREYNKINYFANKFSITFECKTAENKNNKNANELNKKFLNDIDTTKEKVYNGCYISLVNIDIPVVPWVKEHAIVLISEDENKDVQRVAIYGLGIDSDYISKTFIPGCQFKIINPFLRLAIDGKPMIRVNDPKSVLIEGYITKICRTCGKEQCKLLCSICKNSYFVQKNVNKMIGIFWDINISAIN